MKLLNEFTGAERIGLVVWAVVALLLVTFGIIRATPEPVSDLAAQQSMANAAWAMFWITSVSALGSLLALIFVWQTVRYTQETARAATEATRLATSALVAEHRAWLEPKDLKTDQPLSWFEGRLYLTLKPCMENVGNEPALEVHTDYSLLFGAANEVAEHAGNMMLRAMKQGAEDKRWVETLFPGRKSAIAGKASGSLPDTAELPEDFTVVVVVSAYYRTHSDVAWHMTAATYELAQVNGFTAMLNEFHSVGSRHLSFALAAVVAT